MGGAARPRGLTLRILLVNNRFPPHMTGGYEISAALAARGLADRGHDVEVLVSRFGVRAATDVGGVRRRLHRIVDSASPLRQLAHEWSDRGEVARALRRFRPDLVSAWNLQGLFPSVLRAIVGSEVPAVFHLHDVYFDQIAGWALEWRDFWRRPVPGVRGGIKALAGRWARSNELATGWPEAPGLVPLANAVFCSDFIRRENASRGIVAGQARVILSGVDTGRFHPEGRRPSPELRLLFAGRLHESKGAHLALDAVEAMILSGVTGVSLRIVGAVPPDRRYYDLLVARAARAPLAGKVIVGPQVSHDAMPALYREHDVFVNPTRHLEGLPRSAMEAMACGCVVVGYATGGGDELFVDDENAIVVDPSEPAALASALRDLARQQDRRERLAIAAARFIAEHHAVVRVVAETESFYQEVVGRG